MASDSATKLMPRPNHITFADLPKEIQREIFSHCSQTDHICLSLVSKAFRELAAGSLYRQFHIVFPDDDDPAFDSPIDGLAGGLDTFVTSDYNYAKHLRELSLDTLSSGSKAETAYKAYLYSNSCGKFMNTLLLLTLRKANLLDTFKWNIRVELSRQVYKALHDIETLRHVQIRMQAGPSQFEPPPPLPFNPPHSAPLLSHAHDFSILTGFALPPQPFYIPPAVSLPPPPLPKPPVRTKAPRKTAKEPPTLSGFKDLTSLCVLDIDSLDMITELKSCVRASSMTLTKLKLSFSDSLAMAARKPPPDLDPDDSDPDDEFQVVPAGAPIPGPNYAELSAPARAFRAQEERKSQESVLGRIFEVEPYLIKKSVRRPREKEAAAAKEGSGSSASQDFLDSIKAVSIKLMSGLNGSADFSSAQQDILDTIEAAAKKYVASENAKGDDKKQDKKNGEKGEVNKEVKSEVNGESSTASGNGVVKDKPSEEPQQPESSMFDPKKSATTDGEKDVKPEDINIEEPEEVLAEETQDVSTGDASILPGASSPQQDQPQGSDESKENVNGQVNGNPANGIPSSSSGSSVAKAVANLAAQRLNFKTLSEKLEFFEIQAKELSKEVDQLDLSVPGDSASATKRIEDAGHQLHLFTSSIEDIQKEMAMVAAEIDDAEKQSIPAAVKADSPEVQEERIGDYIRSTRGIGLECLSIHLIPVKASVLSRGIDIRVLKKITLLNVGPQAPIWVMFAKENKMQPIALRNIYTDNVSLAFLTFVSQLEELHELFMLERPEKCKPESFAPKTPVKMDQLRRLVLRKHLPTLKRLLIKNQQDLTWDVDEKTMLLISRRGKVLEELAVSMGIRAVHTLLQHISGLTNLRALHILQLRNDDTCVWVMREVKKFLVDNLAHYPDMKLEWIAIDEDERVERIIRYTDPPKKDKKTKSKDKGKAVATSAVGTDQFPVLAVEGWDIPGSESDDEDEGDTRPKIETLDNIHFYDVYEVRIFRKDIVSGKL